MKTMTFEVPLTDIERVIAFLDNFQKETTEDRFILKLGEILDFYKQHLPKLAQSFAKETIRYDESWCKKEMRYFFEPELDKLLRSDSFDAADELYKKNIKYIDENWYLDLVVNRVINKFKFLINQFRQLQENVSKRFPWNQNYLQHKQDNELFSVTSKWISEIEKGLSEISDLSIIDKEDKIASSRIQLEKLEAILKSEKERKRSITEALNSPWEFAFSLKSLTELESPFLSENDNRLITEWIKKPDNREAMISARKAELAAIKLYRNIYGNSEDISIIQIDYSKDERWKYADIETNGRWIDVKNARRSSSSKNSYSEHYVPNFKTYYRNQSDVAISSLLSPCRGDHQPIIWLGETTLGEIITLQNEFNSSYLKVQFKKDMNGRFLLKKYLNGRFLPTWLFDYPSECYKNRDNALSVIRSPDFVFPYEDINIANMVLANRVVHGQIEETLCTEEALMLQNRINKCGLRRPVLFLHVLDRFCRTLLNKRPFKDCGIEKLLFTPEHRNKKVPLGVYDPLETVWNLWNVLVAVSDKCLQEVRNFTVFHLARTNILQGNNGGKNWLTIFAYCGGPRCGQNPIYIGQDKTCRMCGHLICHRCGYCSKECGKK